MQSQQYGLAGIRGAIWRWHFYAAVFVMPFLAILATTGILMAISGPIENYRHADQLFVEPGGVKTSATNQIKAVLKHYPQAKLVAYMPAKAPDRSSEVILTDVKQNMGPDPLQPAATTLSIYVNPYTDEVLGAINKDETLYAFAKEIHGTLLLGTVGDYLVEIVASLSVLLVISGLLLWWPRQESNQCTTTSLGGWLRPRTGNNKRETYRSIHASIGLWSTPVLLFFLISGLAWTPIWGEKFTQAWSSFPSERFSAPTASLTHKDLNHGAHKVSPWALEQTPLPISIADNADHPSGFHETGALASMSSQAIDLDTLVAFATRSGFETFRVLFPQSNTGAWTISAVTMSGDVEDPRQDRTLHLNQYTGEVLADVGFVQYSMMGQVMAASISLHQAGAGALNVIVNLVLCFAVLGLLVTGSLMWWKRRPANSWRLAPPAMPRNTASWRTICIVMLILGIAFPLALITLLSVLLLDWLLFARIGVLQSLLK